MTALGLITQHIIWKQTFQKQFVNCSERFYWNSVVLWSCSNLNWHNPSFQCDLATVFILLLFWFFFLLLLLLLYTLRNLEMYRFHSYTCSCEAFTEGQIPKNNHTFSLCGVSTQVTSFKTQFLQEWSHNCKIFDGNETDEKENYYEATDSLLPVSPLTS